MTETKRHEVSATWFFELMANLFDPEWTKIYKPKNTRAMGRAKDEWAGVINEYDQTFLEYAAKKARRHSPIPPSSLDFWSLLKHEQAKIHKANPKPLPNRALGESALANVHALLGK